MTVVCQATQRHPRSVHSGTGPGNTQHCSKHALSLGHYCAHIYCSLSNPCPPQQVHFIVNNLSTANLPSKGGALKDLLPKEFWPWFANYMVVKRAAQVRPSAHATRICCTECSTAALHPPCQPDTPRHLLFVYLLQEPNFHGLYLALLDKLGDKKLTESLVATTHKYIRILLASDRIKTHTSERSLLKNLGTWCALSPPALPQAGC